MLGQIIPSSSHLKKTRLPIQRYRLIGLSMANPSHLRAFTLGPLACLATLATCFAPSPTKSKWYNSNNVKTDSTSYHFHVAICKKRQKDTKPSSSIDWISIQSFQNQPCHKRRSSLLEARNIRKNAEQQLTCKKSDQTKEKCPRKEAGSASQADLREENTKTQNIEPWIHWIHRIPSLDTSLDQDLRFQSELQSNKHFWHWKNNATRKMQKPGYHPW